MEDGMVQSFRGLQDPEQGWCLECSLLIGWKPPFLPEVLDFFYSSRSHVFFLSPHS